MFENNKLMQPLQPIGSYKSGGDSFKDYQLAEDMNQYDLAKIKSDNKAYLLKSINSGIKSVFYAGSVNVDIEIVPLTEKKALVVYANVDLSSKLEARVVNIGENDALTFGDTLSYSTSVRVSNLAARKINSTKVVAAYSNIANSNRGECLLFSISSEDVVTVVGNVSFTNFSTSQCSISVLSETQIIVTYSDLSESGYGKAVGVGISGNDLSINTTISTFRTASVSSIASSELTDTKAIVVFRDSATSNYGRGTTLTKVGTSITVGGVLTFSSLATSYISLTMINSGSVAVVYYGSSGKGTAVLLTITGDSIAAGTSIIFENSTIGATSLCKLSNSLVMAVYRNATTNNRLTACKLEIKSTGEIVPFLPIVIDTATAAFEYSALSVCNLSATKAITAYADTSTANGDVVSLNTSPTGKFGQILATAPSAQTRTFKMFESEVE